MTTKLIFIFLLVLPFSLMAQTEELLLLSRKNTTLQVNVANGYSGRSNTSPALETVEFEEGIESRLVRSNSSTSGRYALSVRIVVERSWGERWSVKSGMHYLHVGSRIEYTDMVYDHQYDPRYGLLYEPLGVSFKEYDITSRNQFLMVPVLLQRQLFTTSAWTWHAEGGVEGGIHLTSTDRIETTTQEGKHNTQTVTDPFNAADVQLSATLGMSASRAIHERMSVSLGLRGGYFVLPVNTEDDAIHPYWVGLDVGIRYLLTP